MHEVQEMSHGRHLVWSANVEDGQTQVPSFKILSEVHSRHFVELEQNKQPDEHLVHLSPSINSSEAHY